MDVSEAAQRWATVWQRAWSAKDAEAIVALYAEDAEYRALVLRPPELGVSGVRAYLERIFAEEDDIECRFGEPVASGDRAAVEWWASWTEDGAGLTMAGVTVLRFDEAAMVIDHRDYWNARPVPVDAAPVAPDARPVPVGAAPVAPDARTEPVDAAPAAPDQPDWREPPFDGW